MVIPSRSLHFRQQDTTKFRLSLSETGTSKSSFESFDFLGCEFCILFINAGLEDSLHRQIPNEVEELLDGNEEKRKNAQRDFKMNIVTWTCWLYWLLRHQFPLDLAKMVAGKGSRWSNLSFFEKEDHDDYQIDFQV